MILYPKKIFFVNNQIKSYLNVDLINILD